MVFSFFWLLVSTYEVYAAYLGSLGLDLSTKSSFYGFSGSSDLFFGNSFYHDGFSQGGRIFILLISIIFMLLLRFEFQNDSKLRRIEFLFLFLVGSALSMLMISASSLLSLFLAVEGLVMVMYVLTAGSSIQSGFPIVKILRFRAVEGALKYAITNAVATGFFLLGAVLLFFFTGGDLYFVNIFKVLKGLDFAGFTGHSSAVSYFVTYYGLLLGVVLIALTFLFKMGAVPFHNWMADLYEASVPGVLTFFLLVPKAAILLTFLNLNRFLFAPFSDFFIFVFFFIGLLSAVVGSVHALYQLKIERLLAYSSVAHAGGFLLLLSAVSFSADRPFHLVIFFVIAYIFVNALFLSVYLSLRYSGSFFSHSYIKSFKLFSHLTPSAQKVISTIFFNLAGLPPFLGWFLKALVLIVWVKACFFVRSTDLFIGSGLETLFDFNSVLVYSDGATTSSFLLSNFQENVVIMVCSVILDLLN
jgi:NADH-quinone oxidoreductase subunit N